MTTNDNNAERISLAEELERKLLALYGPLLTGDELRSVLGYKSMDALRQSIVRKTIPVKVFTVENRRGKFAFTRDVAQWQASLQQNEHKETGGE